MPLGDNLPGVRRPAPASAAILVFQPPIALVQPGDLALEPFAFALDPLNELPFDKMANGEEIDMHRRDACRIRPGCEGESSL